MMRAIGIEMIGNLAVVDGNVPWLVDHNAVGTIVSFLTQPALDDECKEYAIKVRRRMGRERGRSTSMPCGHHDVHRETSSARSSPMSSRNHNVHRTASCEWAKGNPGTL